MYRSAVVLLTVSILAVVDAKPPSQLKTELEQLLPQGKKARFAWIQGGVINDNPNDPSVNIDLYVLDSDEATPRRIASKTETGSARLYVQNPQITNDGTRVVFTHKDNNKVYLVGWNGGAVTEIGYGYVADYYYEAGTGKDFALCTASELPGGSVFLIDLATKAQRNISMNHGPDPDDGIGISPDGSYIAAYLDQGNDNLVAGYENLTTHATVWQTGSVRGCVLSVAPENSSGHKFMHQDGPHVSLLFFGTNGSLARTVDITTPAFGSSLPKNTCAGTEKSHNRTRWSNHYDYVMTSMNFSTGNPYVVKVSDPTKFVALQDGIGCTRTERCDMRVADSWGGGSSVAFPGHRPNAPDESQRAVRYGIDGRRLDMRAGNARSPGWRVTVEQCTQSAEVRRGISYGQ